MHRGIENYVHLKDWVEFVLGERSVENSGADLVGPRGLLSTLISFNMKNFEFSIIMSEY